MTILACRFSAGDDLYIRGDYIAKYQIKLPASGTGIFEFKEYSDNGYTQRISIKESDIMGMEININCEDLHSSITFPVKYDFPTWMKPFLGPSKEIQSDDPLIINLTRQVISGSKYQNEAVYKILRWINDNITYKLDPKGPKTALDVLFEKRGYCVGYSNLAVAMLRSAGIPARNVHGIHIDSDSLLIENEYMPLSLKGVTLHRWIEVFYPDVGWVFSDPRFSVNHIGANYIYLAYQDGFDTFPAELLEGTMIKIESKKNSLRNLDWSPDGDNLLLIRPNNFQRKMGLVNIKIQNKGLNLEKTEIILASLDQVRRLTPDKEGKSAITGLEGGEYELKIRYNGKLVYLNKFGLKDKQELNLDIMLESEENLK